MDFIEQNIALKQLKCEYDKASDRYQNAKQALAKQVDKVFKAAFELSFPGEYCLCRVAYDSTVYLYSVSGTGINRELTGWLIERSNEFDLDSPLTDGSGPFSFQDLLLFIDTIQNANPGLVIELVTKKIEYEGEY